MIRQLNFSQKKERHIRDIKLSCGRVALTLDDETNLGRLLVHGDIGNSFYDIFNSYLMVRERLDDSQGVLKLYGMLYDFSYKYTEIEYLSFINKVYVRSTNITTPEFSTVFLILICLLDTYYGDGVITSFNQATGIVTRESIIGYGIANLFDFIALIAGVLIYDKGKLLATPSGFQVKSMVTKSVYQTTCQLFDSEILGAVKSLNTNKLGELLHNSLSNFSVLNLVGHYKMNPDSYSSPLVSVLQWEREDFTSDSMESAAAKIFIDAQPTDIFENRKVILREKGVIVRNKNNKFLFDSVVCMFLKEEHDLKNDYHNICVTLVNDLDVCRTFVIDICNAHVSKVTFLYGIDVVAMPYIYKVCGLLDADTLSTNALKFIEDVPEFDMENSEGFVEPIKSGILDIDSIEFVYEEPQGWNYKEVNSTGCSKVNKAGDIIGYRIDNIGVFVRKLPYGQKASEEAKELARLHRVKLEEGMTFVEGFTRKVGIKATKSSEMNFFN